MSTCSACDWYLNGYIKSNSWLNGRSEFGKTRIKYLGHVVENGMVYADPDKVSVVRTWPKPENVKEVKQFMGLANCYAQYIPNFADIAAPFTSLASP